MEELKESAKEICVCCGEETESVDTDCDRYIKGAGILCIKCYYIIFKEVM